MEDLEQQRRRQRERRQLELYQNWRRIQQRLLILRRCRIRDLNNPYEVTQEAFVSNYRLTKELALDVVEIIRPYMPVTVSERALPLELKFLCVLFFYANGSYQIPCGKSFDSCVAQPTVSVYIEEVTQALNRPELVGRFIKFPRTEEELQHVMSRNRLMGGRLPNVVGYVDGSLIKMKKPPVEQNRQAFIGRKNFACMNVLFTCDRRLYFLNVLARYPGATHDSYIFGQTSIRRQMIEHNTNRPCVLIGDSGFTLEPWMVTPFARQDEPERDTPEARFNQDLCHDRCYIERAIGTIKERFRAINNERTLHYEPVKACRLVVAVSVLHNLCILSKVPQYAMERARNEMVNEDFDANFWHLDGHVLDQGRQRREQMVQYLEERGN